MTNEESKKNIFNFAKKIILSSSSFFISIAQRATESFIYTRPVR